MPSSLSPNNFDHNPSNFEILHTIAGLVLAEYFVRNTQPELIIGLVVILGVSVLIILLFIMASGFALLGLHGSRQAMGLPEGSIRAMIALLLIIIRVIFSIYLFNAVQNQSASTNSAQVLQLSQQLFTTMGTLVVAISAFYFGSTNLEAARRALTPSISAERPAIQSINPVTGKQGQELELTIIGKSFRLPGVRLMQGNEQMEATDILSSATQIKCKITIPANQKLGKWDIIVVNEDGREDQLKEAFEVTESK